ncbi:MAG: bifunctional heptose 7-phosphate kinase/heptose 1-phosphate adenyltransferase [Planctomycetia bacterium]|nr:bifunctional heptose 7-phosphate kinase/heptose 1-phosphate adenyltransferase [Planctomycetia bacterium]
MTNHAIHRDILDTIGHPHILVVGDLILDRYTFGNAERVSPEAPVVVLRVDDKDVRLGGAASVAMLLRGLEAEVTLAGVIGDDHEGRTLLSLLRDDNIDCHMVLVDPNRPTTTKERIIGRAANRHSHQIVRVDHEARDPINSTVEGTLIGELDRLVRSNAESLECRLPAARQLSDPFAAILIADYAKGVCTPTLLRRVIDIARGGHIPVLVDPARIADFSRYAGATLLKPNRTEAELMTGRPVINVADALELAQQIRRDLSLDAAIVTLDSEGMVLALHDDASEHIPCEAREIYDITGAGDIILATLGLCLASNLPLPQAAHLSNIAAALEIARLGVAPVSRMELSRSLQSLSPPLGEGRGEGTAPTTHSSTGGFASAARRPFDSSTLSSPGTSSRKISTLPALLPLLDEYRHCGKTLVFTNGCFDLLHVGHVACLQQAAALGDVLIVAINSDATVRSLKGPGRPVMPADDRARMLASLACVTYVLIFDDPTPHSLLKQIRPDVLAKGGTTAEIIGHEVVEFYGGRAVCLGEVPGVSTTTLISKFTPNLRVALQHEKSVGASIPKSDIAIPK